MGMRGSRHMRNRITNAAAHHSQTRLVLLSITVTALQRKNSISAATSSNVRTRPPIPEFSMVCPVPGSVNRYNLPNRDPSAPGLLKLPHTCLCYLDIRSYHKPYKIKSIHPHQIADRTIDGIGRPYIPHRRLHPLHIDGFLKRLQYSFR